MSASDVVLASASPRRRDLLAALGVAVRVIPADVDERALPGEAPPALVARLAAAKAGAVQARLAALAAADGGGRDGGADALVIAADTVVVVDGEVLGKPADATESRAFIERLAGRSHVVLSGHCLWRAQHTRSHVERTVVTFRPLDESDVAAYVASGEGDDKAGAYAIQGRGAGLVERIEGCYSNVVGLSLPTVITLARALGVRLG
jgi:septum formation protein